AGRRWHAAAGRSRRAAARAPGEAVARAAGERDPPGGGPEDATGGRALAGRDRQGSRRRGGCGTLPPRSVRPLERRGDAPVPLLPDVARGTEGVRSPSVTPSSVRNATPSPLLCGGRAETAARRPSGSA